MGTPFVHLDVRSCFSLKEGAFTPEQLVHRAAELNMPAVAIADRDGLYGAARFVKACEEHGVKPILGASLTIRAGGPAFDDGKAEGSPRRTGLASGRRPARRAPQPPGLRADEDTHIVVLAQDAEGYANLCRLITDAHMLGERSDPSVTASQICAHAAGLVALLGPTSAPGRLAVAGRVDAASRAAGPYRDAFGSDRCFVAVEHRVERESHDEVRAMLGFAERLEVGVVATNPVRYLVPEDAFLADALECMRKIVPIAGNHVTRANAEGYLKPAGAMRALFTERPDLCDATFAIAETCTFDLGLKRMHFPDFPVPEGRSASSVLAERCRRGIEDRDVKATQQVMDRLDHELAMIDEMGSSAFFLTVADIVADIKAMGIRCACRGSAAGSLVCYLTAISDVDPVRHDLPFERFMNPMRDEPPDIDIDVESERREDVYDMVLSRHGDDRAACVAMIDTYRARSAVREVGKALGLPDAEIGVVAKAFPHISARHLREAIERLPELNGINLPMPQLELLFRVAERLDGFPRHIALHPCGIVLSNHELVDRVPLERSANGHRMIQADKDDVELLGYLKLDVLGIRMLSSMRHALDEIARTTGEKVDLDRIATDDIPTFELIRASDTLGCFQIESPGQRELLQKLQPTRWEDLIVDISLFRPGPVKSDMIQPYLRRRMGMEEPVYIHPDLRPALSETYGVIVYHEQVIRALAAIAGYDLTYADHIRRHLDHEDMIPGFRADFLERATTRGIDGPAAEKAWAAVAEFASFGFCKAHAAAFAVPTYQSAWLKAHYPAHFLAGILTHDPGMYPRRLLLEDARQHGIPILPLDVNESEPEYVAEEVERDAEPTEGEGVAAPDGFGLGKAAGAASPRPTSGTTNRIFGIRLALQDVHGICDAEIRSIMQARADRPFHDVGDFLRRTTVSRPVTEALAHAGAFDRLRAERQGQKAEENRRTHLYAAMTTAPEREGDQLTLADAAAPSHRFADYSDAEVVRAELEVLGLDATRHIVTFFEPLLADLGVTRTKDLHRCRGGQKVMVAGVKVASQTPAIRSGQRIIFLTLDDATGPVEVTVFESVQPKVAKTVFHAYAMAVWGELRRTGVKGVSIIAEEVWDLTALHRARGEGRLREAMEAPTEPVLPARRLWHSSPGSAG